jgi:hypothetical protein
MTPRLILRTLTPLGWALAASAAVALLLLLGRGLGIHWDPLGLGARRLEVAEHRAEAAAADASARRLEVEGAADLSRRLDQHHQQSVELARVTAAADAESRNAHDADVPLDPARAARLRAHDRELCRLAPDLCRAAAPDPAAGGDDALPAGPPA